MIKRLMILDGVMAVCHFRDDGQLDEAYGMRNEEEQQGLASFAHDYKRIIQGNADQLSMFTGMRGWTPPTGWVVRGQQFYVCSVGNVVCLVDGSQGSVNEVMQELTAAAKW